MDSLGGYGNLSLIDNNGISSSMWSNHQIHEFSQGLITYPMSDNPHHNHISKSNPISVVPNRTYNNMILNSPSSLLSDFGINMGSRKTASLDSLNCLISATNSINTDTSVEDDGISVLFSSPQQTSSPNSFTKIPSSTSKRTHDQISQVLSFEGGDNLKNSKKPRSLGKCLNSSNISFQQPSNSSVSSDELDSEAIQQMKEMVYRAAAFRPVNLGVEIADKPKRKNVKISNDPQTVAARQRRERISERIRVLQRLVPGGNKMDTASMLDEAANYLKFLRSQIKALEGFSNTNGLISNNYKLDNQMLFNNHHLMTLGSLFPMQNLFPIHSTPSLIHQAEDLLR